MDEGRLTPSIEVVAASELENLRKRTRNRTEGQIKGTKAEERREAARTSAVPSTRRIKFK